VREVAQPVAERLDLTRRRTLGDIVTDAVALFGAHSGVFFTATLLVVAPVTVLVDGVWGRMLADGVDAQGPAAATLVSTLLTTLLIPPLVTAVHAGAVVGLGQGVAPTLGGVLRTAFALYAPLLAVLLLFALAVLCGLVLLVIPGIWLSTRWYFGPQVVVVEGLRGRAALRRSGDLVAGRWWRVFATLLVLGLLTALAAGIVTAAVGAAGNALVYVVVLALMQSVALSVAALGATLLFFDLREHPA
jgi:hypothetical protein